MENITTAIGAINTATELLRTAFDIAKKKKDSEILSIIADIQSELIKVRESDDNIRRQFDLTNKIIRHSDGLYITLSDDPDNIRYCSTCWGKDGKLIQIGSMQCNICHTRLFGYENDIEKLKRDANRPHII